MPKQLREGKRQEITNWMAQTMFAPPPDPPSPTIERGRFEQAQREWQSFMQNGFRKRKIDPYTIQDFGPPVASYEKRGFQIIETTRGFTARPVIAAYSERKLFPYPYSWISDQSLRDIILRLEFALRHVHHAMKACNEFGPDAIFVTETHKADYRLEEARLKLFHKWKWMCDALDKLEDILGWEELVQFCAEKALLTRNDKLYICADDALGAYVNLRLDNTEPYTLSVGYMKTALIPHMESDLEFVLKNAKDMLKNVPDRDRPYNPPTDRQKPAKGGPHPSPPEIISWIKRTNLETERNRAAGPSTEATPPASDEPSSQAGTTDQVEPKPKSGGDKPKGPKSDGRKPVHGRFTNSFFHPGHGDRVPRPDWAKDLPRHQSIFHEDLSDDAPEMDLDIAFGKSRPDPDVTTHGALPEVASSSGMSVIQEEAGPAAVHEGPIDDRASAEDRRRRIQAWEENKEKMDKKRSRTKELIAKLKKEMEKTEQNED